MNGNSNKISSKQRDNDHHELKTVLIFYFVCVVIRFVSGAYLKHIETMADETIYRHMAESFANGRGFRVHNAVFDGYTRKLYSLLLSPAFLFDNRYVQTLILQLINSALISSALFPYALLIKRYIDNRKIRIVSYVFFLLLPELCQCVTFASENLYLPLTTWYIYFFIRSLDGSKANSMKTNLFLGSWLYLMKLCKNASIILAGATALFYIYESMGEKGVSFKIERLVRRIIDMIMIIGAYAVLVVIGKNIWMTGVAGYKPEISVSKAAVVMLVVSMYIVKYMLEKNKSDAQTLLFHKISICLFWMGIASAGISVIAFIISAPIRVKLLEICGFNSSVFMNKIGGTSALSLIQYAVYTLMYILMALGLIPALIPFIYSKELKNGVKQLHVVNICMIAASVAFVTVYFMPSRELQIPVRVSMRYMSFLWLPCVIPFLSMYEDRKEKIDNKKNIIFMILMFLFIVFFKGAVTGSSIDMDMLFYIVYHFTYVMWQLKIPLVVLAIAAIPLFHRNRKLLFSLFFAGFACVLLLDNALILKDHHDRYGMSDEKYAKIKETEDFIRSHPDDSFVLVQLPLSDYSGTGVRITDTFYGGLENVYTINALYFASRRVEYDGFELGSKEICPPRSGNAQTELKSVKYLLIENDIPYIIHGENTEMIRSDTEGSVDIYEMKNDKLLPNIDYDHY